MSSLSPRLPRNTLTQGKSINGAVDQAIANFAASVVRAKDVPPLITEIVRLRCAQVHDCRLCGSLRNREALENGFKEDMQKKIGGYENSNFAPEIKAALKLCDAMILNPMSANAKLKDELRRYFSEQQIAEICFDVMKWSQQKALVALRLEEPPWDTTNLLYFDDEGNPHFGGPAYN